MLRAIEEPKNDGSLEELHIASGVGPDINSRLLVASSMAVYW